MRILVTGSQGGLGLEIVSGLRACGHRVIGSDVTPGADIDPHGVEASIFWERVERGLDGHVEGVVFAQGITCMDLSESHSAQDFGRVLNTNLVDPFSKISTLIERYQRRDLTQSVRPLAVRFVAIGSESAHYAMSQSHGYVASKAGLEALMRVFARDCARRHPHVFFTVAPGSIQGTPMTEHAMENVRTMKRLSAEDANAYLSRNPLERMTTKEEVLDVIKFCLFDAPEAMSGATFKMPMASGRE